MRKIFVFCLLLFPLLSAVATEYRVEQIPNVQQQDKRRYVSNPDGILTPEAVVRLDSLCASLRAQGLAQVAIVAVDEIAGGDVFSFAIELFRQWGVGNSQVDNGLGILLVKNQREVRFVTGGGLEGVLPDAICKRIQLNYMIPSFRKGDYSQGLVDGVSATAQLLEGNLEELATAESGDEMPTWVIFALLAGFVVLPLGAVLVGYYRNKRCPRCHKFTLNQQSQQIIKVTRTYRMVEYTYLCSHCGMTVKRQARNMRDDSLSGGIGGGTIIGGGRGFGGGGGGFGGGGFGGGSFGGGGAGSKW